VTAFFVAPASPGTDHPEHTVFPCPGCECQCDGVTAVGQRLQDQIALDEGLDYFQVEGERDRLMLAARRRVG
jgi:hypothetical protein